MRKLILFLLFSPLACLASPSEKCIQKSDHKALSVVLIDLSDKIESAENFKKSMAVFTEMIQPGERLVMGISADKVGDVKLLMDFVNPENSLWESTLKIRALQKHFRECVDENIARILAFDQKYDKSAILETINFTSKLFSADASEIKKLFLYSDMMQNSPSISFYKQKELDVKSLFSATEKEELVPDLKKIDVYVAGVGGMESDKILRKLEKYWKTVFDSAGATLKYFGPVLVNL